MINGQIAPRDQLQLTQLLAKAQRRSLRRLGEWGDTVMHPREWLLAEAEDLEMSLSRMLLPALEDYLGIRR